MVRGPLTLAGCRYCKSASKSLSKSLLLSHRRELAVLKVEVGPEPGVGLLERPALGLSGGDERSDTVLSMQIMTRRLIPTRSAVSFFKARINALISSTTVPATVATGGRDITVIRRYSFWSICHRKDTHKSCVSATM